MVGLKQAVEGVMNVEEEVTDGSDVTLEGEFGRIDLTGCSNGGRLSIRTGTSVVIDGSGSRWKSVSIEIDDGGAAFLIDFSGANVEGSLAITGPYVHTLDVWEAELGDLDLNIEQLENVED